MHYGNKNKGKSYGLKKKDKRQKSQDKSKGIAQGKKGRHCKCRQADVGRKA